MNKSRFPFFLMPWLCAALCALPGRISAEAYYATPTGAGMADGTSWATAFSNVQDAVTLATNAADKIYLQWGVYSNSAQIVISNAAGVTIVGGCIGDGANDYSGTNSTLTRAGGVMRILYSHNSTITLASVTISGGYLTNDNLAGAGMYLSGGSATLSNCVVTRNSLSSTTANNFGGGIYSSDTILELVDCILSTNSVHNSSGGSGYGGVIWHSGGSLTMNRCQIIRNQVIAGNIANAYGGAIYCTNATLVMDDSYLETCYVSGRSYGGGLYLTGGAGRMTQCIFSNVYASGNSYGYGGAVYASRVNPLDMIDCRFTNCNLSSSDNASVLYLAGSTGAMNTCVMNAYGSSGGAKAIWLLGGSQVTASNLALLSSPGVGIYASASRLSMRDSAVEANRGHGIYQSGGNLGLTNCLITGSWSNGIFTSAGTAMVINCTLATNTGWGITNAGVLTVKNSIVWANSLGGIATNATTTITYSDVQDATPPGAGNMSQDPLFVDLAGGDFHAKSLAGSWREGGVWTNDLLMSPCIDAGEPAPGSAFALEPKPNGGRVNMGAYGNTAQASRSSRGTVIRVW